VTTTLPKKLVEIVENDAYLARVQLSMTLRHAYLLRQDMPQAALVVQSLRSRIVELRATYRQEIEQAALGIPIVYSATGVKGIGPLVFLRLAVKLDIRVADTPAALWRYCGMGVTGGYADPVATTIWPGMVRYNERARRSLNDIRAQLMKKNSDYRPLYDGKRRYYEAQGLSGVVAHNRASRFLVKQWLKHLWRVWRRLEGLPLGTPHEDDLSLTAPYGWR
jgi:hypothetical protein